MWHNHVVTLLSHFTSWRRSSALDCRHRHVGAHFLQP